MTQGTNLVEVYRLDAVVCAVRRVLEGVNVLEQLERRGELLSLPLSNTQAGADLQRAVADLREGMVIVVK